jgi:hypothetical protein
MISRPKEKSANDIPDIQPPPAPDILPGDPEGMKPVNEPSVDNPQRTNVND